MSFFSTRVSHLAAVGPSKFFFYCTVFFITKSVWHYVAGIPLIMSSFANLLNPSRIYRKFLYLQQLFIKIKNTQLKRVSRIFSDIYEVFIIKYGKKTLKRLEVKFIANSLLISFSYKSVTQKENRHDNMICTYFWISIYTPTLPQMQSLHVVVIFEQKTTPLTGPKTFWKASQK